MPRRTNEFQELVRRLYELFAGPNCSVDESVLLKEKNSSAVREVDIVVTSEIAGHVTRLAIECRDHQRDQDVTWIDGLIGKFSNLSIDKVVAVSASAFSITAYEKAAQHNIELLTVQQATEADWQVRILPSNIRFSAFRNRPMRISIWLNTARIFYAEYDFDGLLLSLESPHPALESVMLDTWRTQVSLIASETIRDQLSDGWDKLYQQPNTPRYCELVQRFKDIQTYRVDESFEISYTRIVWGIGTKYTLNGVQTELVKLEQRAAAIATCIAEGSEFEFGFTVSKDRENVEGLVVRKDA